MQTIKRPNPERVYAVIASILERRYDVKIEYTIEKQGGHYEQNRV